ncbi:hypothetical protein Krac_10530 [Ktedonobacter racemifer DSM 44963]|uniref:Uncharacterized protein n=1 Tax=Ktedonobacter racemifer DSM 44963 TaxID=485913 RepID=D6THK4_KTERA|nr:hypothetical protein Krac_10530 [Ktedonobacter racemifer DSM 44963]
MHANVYDPSSLLTTLIPTNVLEAQKTTKNRSHLRPLLLRQLLLVSQTREIAHTHRPDALTILVQNNGNLFNDHTGFRETQL